MVILVSLQLQFVVLVMVLVMVLIMGVGMIGQQAWVVHSFVQFILKVPIFDLNCFGHFYQN